MNTHHVCFSGSLACSGVNPCETCFNFVNQHVLAYAMQQFPMTIDQGRAFFRLIEDGWKRLHVQMMNDPNVQQRALDVSRVRIDPLPPPPPPVMTDPRRMPFAAPPLPPPVPSGFGPQPLANIHEAARVQGPPPAPAEPGLDASRLTGGHAATPDLDPEAMMAALVSHPQFIMAMMPMMMQAMQMQMPMMQGMQMPMMQGMQMPPSEETEEVTAKREAAQLPASPGNAFPDDFTHVAPIAAPPPPPPPEAPAPTAATSNSDALAVAPPKVSAPLMTEMTVEDVMLLASPFEAKVAPADVVETLNGASNEIHVAQTREPDSPRSPTT